MSAKIVATYAGVQIEQSCNHFYPVFDGDMEFKTLKAAQLWVIFEYLRYRTTCRRMNVWLMEIMQD